MAKKMLSNREKDALFERLKANREFREEMKKDWRQALKAAEIDASAVAEGVLSRREVESFAGQRAAWTIEIVISAGRPGLETIQVAEAVNFEKRG